MNLPCQSTIVAEYDSTIAVEEGHANDARTIRKGGDEPLVSLECTVHVAVSALNALGGSTRCHGHDLKGDLAVSGLVHLNFGGSIIVGVHHGVCVGEGSNRGRRNEEGGEEGNGLVHDEGGLFVVKGKNEGGQMGSILDGENHGAVGVGDGGIDDVRAFGQLKGEALVGQVGLIQAGIVASEEGPISIGVHRQYIHAVCGFDNVHECGCMVAVGLG